MEEKKEEREEERNGSREGGVGRRERGRKDGGI